MRLFWSEKAVKDLNAIYDYYFFKSPAVGIRYYNTILTEAERLIKNPQIGMIDQDLSTNIYTVRSLVILDGLYKILYIADKKQVGIYRIWACRKNPKDKSI